MGLFWVAGCNEGGEKWVRVWNASDGCDCEWKGGDIGFVSVGVLRLWGVMGPEVGGIDSPWDGDQSFAWSIWEKRMGLILLILPSYGIMRYHSGV